jgi:hypothetical protein
MMARKRSMANYPGARQFCLESSLAGGKKSSQANILDTHGKRVTAEAAIPAELVREVTCSTPEQPFRECLELPGCYGVGKVRKLAEIVAGEWAGAHERLGRNRPALSGFNSEKEASWTG